MSSFERAIWDLDVLTMFLFLARLLFTGLFREYRWFFSYLSVSFLESIVLLAIPYGTNQWARIYMAGQGVRVLLSIMVVLELFRVALVNQPALGAFGRSAAAYGSALALLIAACGLAIDPSIPAGQSPILHRFFVLQRTADFSVATFLLMIAWFVMWFPVRVKSNVALYSLGFVIYFLAEFTSLLAQNLLPFQFLEPANIAMLGVSFLCLGAWLFGMRREGEQRTTVVGHGRNAEATLHLAEQLQGINDALGRFAKR